jgi:Ca2+-transporting ATPase
MPLAELLSELRTDENGLSDDETVVRLRSDGPNLMQAKKARSSIVKFLAQFKQSLILILIATGILCLFLNYVTDGIVIFLVVILNAIMGYIQEFRAEKALHSLKRLTAQDATVIRSGSVQTISAADLVRGDIAVLEAGKRVPADCRLLKCKGLEIDESILTGESNPTQKEAVDLPKDVPLPERSHMAYQGTTITSGDGLAVVTAIGMQTEVGKITKLVIEEEAGETPLTKQLDKFGKLLAVIALILGVFLFLVEWYRIGFSLDFRQLVQPMLAGISLMVAVIPEGLPVVVALTLTIGMQLMARRNAIVRRLTSVETLGSTTVICTDKTGTLTRNEMTVKLIHVGRKEYVVTGDGYSSEGSIKRGKSEVDLASEPDLELLLTLGMLCNDARVISKDKGEVLGSPTDRALYFASSKGGLDHASVLKRHPQIEKIPFTSERKLMITFHTPEDDDRVMVVIKGAPEIVFDLCSREMVDGKEVPLEHVRRAWLDELNQRMGLKTYRNLAVAYSLVHPEELSIPSSEERDDIRKYLRKAIRFTLVGVYSIMDPPRPEVKGAIKLCRTAGIKVIMITGDHEATALAIGERIGLLRKGDRAITGTELDLMDDRRFEKVVDRITVYSRTLPQHKMRIVQALRKKGEVVAMTGDGVNDAPALAKADIGIAMGMKGSDVAKDASTMILTDDNFATIVAAVEEGRKIFSNIKRFVRYQISTNVGAIILLISSIFVGLPLPLLPVQILWINILIDGPPAIALGMEPVTANVMKQPPRPKKEGILKPDTLLSIVTLGALMAVGTLFLFYWGTVSYGDDAEGLRRARTIAFCGFVLFQLFNVLNCKSETETLFSRRLIANKFILLAIGACLLLQIVILYVPIMSDLFHTTPLGALDWAIIVGVSVSIIFAEEILKRLRSMHYLL